jgi:diaminobutyrate-2-oxoglutarate transaminase
MIMPVAPALADPRAAFLRRESEVRSYCRSFPAVFASARGAWLTDEDGNSWLDFLAGAGALNYGHNDPALVAAVVGHLQEGGIACSLDLHTVAKRRLLETFEAVVLAPRGLDYKVQFCGPTGTNAVEAALKLARKATRRSGVAGFTCGYHGMTLGALAVSSSGFARGGAGVPLGNSLFLPYDGWHGPHVDTMDLIEDALGSPSSGVDLPAAVILECVQGEGGLNVAGADWLRRLALLCRRRGVLLIVDEVQTGCGRTGGFFSFEAAGIVPDLVVLSKSIGGIGQPMSLVLMRPDLDRWRPGEHNGTFRGNNLAFVAATAALDAYWRDGAFAAGIAGRSAILANALESIRARHPQALRRVKGRGLMQGLECADPAVAERIGRRAFQLGLVIERCGPHDEVVKAMPPLNIPEDDLRLGLRRLAQAVDETLAA